MIEKEQSLKKEFNELQPSLVKWVASVEANVVKLLKPFSDENKVKIPFTYRIKTSSSLIGKAFYRDKNYENPLLDIEDKAGGRVVLLTSEDVEKAGELFIKDDFWNIKESRNIKKNISDSPETFSYQSLHFIVWPKNEIDSFAPELLTCEVQIRTLLQHAYAETSHDSVYKGPYKNDKEMIRHLSKSMALMEATDDYFVKVFELLKDETRRYRNILNLLEERFSELFKSSVSIDYELTDLIFQLDSIVPIDITEVINFSKNKESSIIKAKSNSNSYLFNQPIFLYVAYLFFRHRSVIENHFPLESDVLDDLYRAFGISDSHNY